jgi:Protein tyrosine and serine/threonine kinase
MQAVRHENLNEFFGVCLVEPHVCILMAYAQKGSLQDLLQNETINLSVDFRYSFAIDIAQVSFNISFIFSRKCD